MGASLREVTGGKTMVAEMAQFNEAEKRTYQEIHRAGCDVYEKVNGAPCIPDLDMIRLFFSLSTHLCRK
jgi:hypothetical protein